jgi:hypothetical protein
MDQTSIFQQQSQAAEARREALRWLARRLNWESRLRELRPVANSTHGETKQAA